MLIIKNASNSKNIKLYLAIVFLVCILNFAFGQQNENNSTNQYKNLGYKTFQTQGGWGYDIMDGNSLLIHQPHIPDVLGIHLFVTNSEAEKVAALALFKIKKGVFPPTITKTELDSLKITIK